MTLDDFLPYFLPRTKGCAVPIAKQQALMSLIEFCRRSKVWKEFQTPIVAPGLVTSFAYTPTAATHRVSTLLSVAIDGNNIDVVTPNTGRALDNAGSLVNYAYGRMAGFELRPAQAAGVSIVTFAAVEPAITASTVPDDFTRYVEAIAHGTLYRLFSMPDLTCHNPVAADSEFVQWERAIGAASGDSIDGASSAAPRVSPSWF